jgi:hypothetical protein
VAAHSVTRALFATYGTELYLDATVSSPDQVDRLADIVL